MFEFRVVDHAQQMDSRRRQRFQRPLPAPTQHPGARGQGAGQGQPDSPDARKAILDQLTMQMVIAEEAVKKGLDKTPEVTEKLEVIRQSILANAYVQDFIKSNPVTEEAMKAEYERIKGFDPTVAERIRVEFGVR